MHDHLGTLPTRRHSIIKIKCTVFSQRFQLIKNPDVFHATKSFPLYLKQKITRNKAVNQTKQHQIIYVQNR